jgi:hypothetical protein
MFEQKLLERSGISRGLIFVDTDHGFNLAHLPEHRDATSGLVVARWRGDARDWSIWEALGRPSAYRYRFDPFARHAVPTVEPVGFEPAPTLRFEAEANWPALSIGGGWVRPEHTAVLCASGGRGLRLSPTSAGAMRVDLEAWSPRAATYEIRLGVISRLAEGAEIAVTVAGSRFAGGRPRSADSCWALSHGPVLLEQGVHRLEVESRGDDLMLDYVELRPAGDSPRPAAEGPGQKPPAAGAP